MLFSMTLHVDSHHGAERSAQQRCIPEVGRGQTHGGFCGADYFFTSSSSHELFAQQEVISSPSDSPHLQKSPQGGDLRHILHQQIFGGISREEAKEFLCSATAVASVKDNAEDSSTSESETAQGPGSCRALDLFSALGLGAFPRSDGSSQQSSGVR